MRFSTVMPLLLAAGFANAQFGKGNGQGKGNNNGQNNGQNNGGNNGQNNGQNNGGNNGGNGGGDNGNCLNPNVISKNANNNGLAQAEAGQAASATSPNNFINFCAGKTITDGLQVKGGSCNPIRK